MTPGTASAVDGGGLRALEGEAQALAGQLPALLLDSLRIAQTVAFGIHGRRRPGPGETFWQFRPYEASDPSSQIDWRRSASSDRYFVREREWEAAHTVWLWVDLTPSMSFRSNLARASKRDRALVLMLALAGLLVEGGERVGLIGLMPPTASRQAASRMAERLAEPAAAARLMPAALGEATLGRFSECILIGDFLDPLEEIGAQLTHLAAQGVRGHLVQVLDPSEETLPYQGHVEFSGLEGEGRWLAHRAQDLRERYQERLAEHRAGLAALARRLEWTFLVHHTARPPSEPLLALHAQVAGAAGHYSHAGTARSERA